MFKERVAKRMACIIRDVFRRLVLRDNEDPVGSAHKVGVFLRGNQTIDGRSIRDGRDKILLVLEKENMDRKLTRAHFPECIREPGMASLQVDEESLSLGFAC